MRKVLLFDFDGTIADSFANFLEIVNVLTNKYNLPKLSNEELERLRREDVRTVIKNFKIPFYKIPFIAHDMKNLQRQQISQIKPFKDLPKIIHDLKNRGYMLGIITSNGKENVQAFNQNNNIDIFDYIHSDTSIFGKDKIISNFLKQHSLDKKDVVYIGDEIRDIQASQKVGIKVIAVSWGFGAKEGLKKYHPDFLIDHPKELLEVL